METITAARHELRLKRGTIVRLPSPPRPGISRALFSGSAVVARRRILVAGGASTDELDGLIVGGGLLLAGRRWVDQRVDVKMVLS